ncbi:FecR family protein [Pseudidiomarina sp.]|uniref:FecR family protein n=1 Tax=Pseudidiomarina sp. TaxID=2081707 RepID=UPI003A97DA60
MMSKANANAPHAATASYWVTRLYSGEMTAQEERDLQHWRKADAAHEKAFEEALAVWDLSAELYRTEVIEDIETNDIETSDASQAPASPHPHAAKAAKTTNAANATTAPPLWKKLALAASIAFVSVLLAVNFVPTPTNEQSATQTVQVPTSTGTSADTDMPASSERDAFHITRQAAQMPLEQSRVFSTKVGEVSHIKLDDGSEVSLNTDSRIRVTMLKEERQIELLSGEAFFDVAKDANRPFTVATEEQQITVLGTAFNVRQRSDEKVLKVAVIEGRVAVQRRQPTTTPSQQAPQAQAPARTAQEQLAQTQYLLAGDIGAFSDDNKIIQAQQFEQAKTSQAWRRGVVRFDDDPLQDVVKELNRYRTHKIALRGQQTKDLKISGVFHLKNGDAILNAIAATLPVQVIKEQEHIYIAAK